MHGAPIGQPTLGQKLAALVGRGRKLLGSILGGATGVGVAAVLDAFGIHADPSIAGAIALVLGAAGTWLAPANTPKES